eukprot:363301-Chlamydomonas_euryale.AAC.7
MGCPSQTMSRRIRLTRCRRGAAPKCGQARGTQSARSALGPAGKGGEGGLGLGRGFATLSAVWDVE